MAVGQNEWYHVGVGEFTTHLRSYFSGHWDVRGYDLDFDPWPFGWIFGLELFEIETADFPMDCVVVPSTFLQVEELVDRLAQSFRPVGRREDLLRGSWKLIYSTSADLSLGAHATQRNQSLFVSLRKPGFS